VPSKTGIKKGVASGNATPKFYRISKTQKRSMGVADLGLNGVLYLPLTRYTLAGSVPMHTQDFPASIKISKVTILRIGQCVLFTDPVIRQ